MTYTDFGHPEQNVIGSSTMISEAHWHFLIPTTRIVTATHQNLSFQTSQNSLLSGIHFLTKYFNNWYLIILHYWV